MASPYHDPVRPVNSVRCFRSVILATLFFCQKTKCENTKMKTRTYLVRKHVRRCQKQHLTKTTDSLTAINLLNKLIKAARAEMRLNKTVNISSTINTAVPEEVQFVCGEMRITMDFKGRRIAV